MSRTRRTAASRITRETGTRRHVFHALHARKQPSGLHLELVLRRWWPADHDDWDQIRRMSWGPGPLYPSTAPRQWRR